MKRKETRDDFDDDDDVDLYEIPIVPARTSVTKQQYAVAVSKYLEVIEKISKFAAVAYIICSSAKLTELSPQKLQEFKLTVDSVYGTILKYGLVHSEREDFTRVFNSKNKNLREDVPRKTSLRTHLFWETCKIRWCANRIRKHETLQSVKTMMKEGSKAYYSQLSHKDIKFQRELLSTDNLYKKGLKVLGISPYPKKPVYNFTQRELGQAFFLLSGVWKTIDYTRTLSTYVNSLLNRMCDFFCYSMRADEMDDPELRHPLPKEIHPQFKTSVVKDFHGKSTTTTTRDGQSIPFSTKGKAAATASAVLPLQYAPNFDFVMMSQMRFYNFLNDLSAYEEQPKMNLWQALRSYKSKVTQQSKGINIFTTYPLDKYLSLEVIRRVVLDSCERVSPEQKEATANRYVYGTFSLTDFQWLFYKQPVNLPSYADSFISRACKQAAYTQVVEKTKKSTSDIIRGDADDITLTGFYEWCVLKAISRLFAVQFDIFMRVVYSREEVFASMIYITSQKKPKIVQFFSRYYVYYKGFLYTDDDTEKMNMPSPPANEGFDFDTIPFVNAKRNERTIYHSLLLWMYIMVIDFPTSKKTKAIHSVLKLKYAEYCRKEREDHEAIRKTIISHISQRERRKKQFRSRGDTSFGSSGLSSMGVLREFIDDEDPNDPMNDYDIRQQQQQASDEDEEDFDMMGLEGERVEEEEEEDETDVIGFTYHGQEDLNTFYKASSLPEGIQKTIKAKQRRRDHLMNQRRNDKNGEFAELRRNRRPGDDLYVDESELIAAEDEDTNEKDDPNAIYGVSNRTNIHDDFFDNIISTPGKNQSLHDSNNRANSAMIFI